MISSCSSMVFRLCTSASGPLSGFVAQDVQQATSWRHKGSDRPSASIWRNSSAWRGWVFFHIGPGQAGQLALAWCAFRTSPDAANQFFQRLIAVAAPAAPWIERGNLPVKRSLLSRCGGRCFSGCFISRHTPIAGGAAAAAASGVVAVSADIGMLIDGTGRGRGLRCAGARLIERLGSGRALMKLDHPVAPPAWHRYAPLRWTSTKRVCCLPLPEPHPRALARRGALAANAAAALASCSEASALTSASATAMISTTTRRLERIRRLLAEFVADLFEGHRGGGPKNFLP